MHCSLEQSASPSLGLFGEAQFQPTTRLSLTGGMRFQRSSLDRHGPLWAPGAGYPVDFDQAFEAWLPKLSVSCRVTAVSQPVR